MRSKKGVRIKKKSDQDSIYKLILIATIGISAVLLVAAYGKWFYPAELLKGLDQAISIFELLFVGALFYFRKSFKMWILAAFIFAGWGGYAAFWYQVNLPCSCMGEKLHIPTVLSLSLDALFFVLALLFVRLLGGSKRAIYFAVALGALGVSVGFFFANEIHHHFINVAA